MTKQRLKEILAALLLAITLVAGSFGVSITQQTSDNDPTPTAETRPANE